MGFSPQGSNPGPLHWEHGVLATGPQGKSLWLGLKCKAWEFILKKTGKYENFHSASSRSGVHLKRSLFMLPREEKNESHSRTMLLFFSFILLELRT